MTAHKIMLFSGTIFLDWSLGVIEVDSQQNFKMSQNKMKMSSLEDDDLDVEMTERSNGRELNMEKNAMEELEF